MTNVATEIKTREITYMIDVFTKLQSVNSLTGPPREPGEKISSAKRAQNSAIICSRRGNKLTVMVPRVYMRIEVYFYTNHPSLVPRPSPAPVFDHLQYAKTEGEGLVNLTT